MEITGPNRSVGTLSAGIGVRRAPAQGSGSNDYNVPGQNSSYFLTPESDYNDHVVVETTARPGIVFDASYGVRESSEGSWEASHLLRAFYSADLTVFDPRPSGTSVWAVWKVYP
jgi:hypothetical protein